MKVGLKAVALPYCKLCGGSTIPFGEKRGRVDARTYRFSRCEICNFISVINPCLDFERLYDEAYYRGQGGDPTVDYLFELEHPDQTIRQYEWRGIQQIIDRLSGNINAVHWLDYGCGNGALVRYLRQQKIDAVGFDDGAIVPRVRASGIPILTQAELEHEVGRCSVVTMIEVIEHLPDPIPVLRNVRRFLKSGGILFLTTGNSAPYRKRFLDWRYVMPDVHISYFDSQNMQVALAASGFECTFPGHVAGWDDIIRFKVLKSLGWRKAGILERLVPWSLASWFVDSRVRSSDHPVGHAI